MSPLLSIAIIHFFALISPGPDFFFVTQSAVRQSRLHAFFAALGISFSILIWAICAMSGLHFLFQKMAWLQNVLMIAGGLYLFYMGIQLFKSALNKQPATNQNEKVRSDKSYAKLFLQGFLTNMANPKALVYFSSVFAIGINTNVSLTDQSALLALVFIESLIWFTVVAYLFSMSKINQYYQKFSKKIDGVTGGIFISFGCLLILNRD